MWRRQIPAIITGIAAVLAAGVAGYWPADASKEAVREETKRIADRRDEDAKGAARVLVSELLVTGYEMTDWVADAYMKPFGSAYPIDMPKDDLKLVAAKLVADDWRKVNVALTNVEELQRYVEARSAPAHPLSKQPLSRRSIELVARDVSHLADASFALTDLAEMNDLAFPEVDVEAMVDRVESFARDAGLDVPE